MNEDELREALKKIRVEDVLLQTAATLIDIAARRMGLAEEDGPKQLDQAKLAIEGIRALVPLMTQEQQTAIREPLSQLQMAYAREAAKPAEGDAPEGAAQPDAADAAHPAGGEPKAAEGDAAQPEGGDAKRGDPAARPRDPADEAARAAARAKIWTPPGT